MKAIRPTAHSDHKVYIAHGHSGGVGESVVYGRHGTGVHVVDRPELADSVVTLHIGTNPVVNEAQVLRLTKAARADQDRQARGQRDKGILEQAIEDMLAPRPAPAQQRKRSSWRNYLLFAAVLWVGLLIAYVAQTGKVGQFFVLLLLTPIVTPIWAVMLRVFNSFIR